jgi:Putative Actinobacterial Holin-X, holin superfamily III
VDHDGSTNSAAPAARASDPATDEPPGLRAQLGSTFQAAKRLLTAHIDLAKAEMADIAGSVGRMVGLFAGAFVLMLFAATLFAIGGLLFLGEWLFGSIGWGALLGTLLLIDLALVAVLMALDVSGKRIGSGFLIAVVIGVVVGLVLGLDLTHRGWQAFASAIVAGTAAEGLVMPIAVGTVGGIGALLGLIMGIRAGGRDGVVGRALAGAIGGLILGAILGLVGSIPIGAQVGAAIGVFVALIAWPIVAGRDLARSGVDGDALKKKFTPEASIELGKETIEWVRARTPLVPKS